MHLFDKIVHFVSMPKYQIMYLNLRGKAEPIRLLLNFVQEPFEDHRENYLEYAKHKDKFPLPRLPRLIVDGKLEISYTQCILAYLGRKYGLEGETEEDKAISDMLGTQITNYMDQIKSWVYCLMGITPSDRLNELTESVFLPCVQKDYGPVFEKQLEKTNTGYLVGDKLTWLDFYAACFTDYCMTYGPAECMEQFRRLGYHRNAVFSLPQIQEHLKNRPDTVY